MFDALRVGSIVSDKARPLRRICPRALADEILRSAGDRARCGSAISCTCGPRSARETLIEELAKFGPDDRVGIVSLMDHTPGQRQFRDLTQAESLCRGKRGMTDAEFDEHVADLQALARPARRRRTRPAAVAEAGASARCWPAMTTPPRDQVAVSAGHGVAFAEFPTTLEAARACRAHGIAVMMGAPNLIRGGSHSGNVAAEDLAEAGLLDIVSSDYVPSALLLAALQLARTGTTWRAGCARSPPRPPTRSG